MVAIGGVFLASPDPEALAAWFELVGVSMKKQGDGAMHLIENPGGPPSVLAVHKSQGPLPPQAPVQAEPYARQYAMVNLRVDDLDAVVGALQDAGHEVAGPREYEGLGRFAWTRTPDGHDIELWQA